MAEKKEVKPICPIKLKNVMVHIVGDTPLIMHRWSEKAKRQILAAQDGTAIKKGRDPRRPFDDFIESMYWLSHKPTGTLVPSKAIQGYSYPTYTQEEFDAAIAAGAKFGFPITALKQCANNAAYRNEWVPDRMGLRSAYFLKGTDVTDMVTIQGDTPVMREDNVVVGMGTADLRYRGEFRNWCADFILQYDENGKFKLSELIDCLNAGGFACGIGEWRTEKDGVYGSFHVESYRTLD